jgi:hypothetical protein
MVTREVLFSVRYAVSKYRLAWFPGEKAVPGPASLVLILESVAPMIGSQKPRVLSRRVNFVKDEALPQPPMQIPRRRLRLLLQVRWLETEEVLNVPAENRNSTSSYYNRLFQVRRRRILCHNSMIYPSDLQLTFPFLVSHAHSYENSCEELLATGVVLLLPRNKSWKRGLWQSQHLQREFMSS